MDTTFNDKNSSLSTNSNSSAFWDYKKYKTFEHKKFRKYEKRNPTFSLLDQESSVLQFVFYHFCDKQLTKTLQLSFSLKDEEIKLIVVSPWERKSQDLPVLPRYTNRRRILGMAQISIITITRWISGRNYSHIL